MKMILLQYTLAVKNKLNKQMQEYGYVHFVRHRNSVLFENNIFRINVDGYKLWLDPKKIC